MGRLAFGLLGPTVVIGETGAVPLPGVLRRRLLTRLLMSANQPVPVDVLREDLWEGRPPRSAATTLKSHVSLLRRALGDDQLAFDNGAYIITVAPEDLDIWLFEEEAVAGRTALREAEIRRAAECLDRALSLWRGPALADAGGAAWATPVAVRLEELRAASLEAWLEARIGLGEHHEVVAAAEAAVGDHPLREGLWAKLILALYRCGRQADALRAYQRIRARLGDELGIEPGPELADLEVAVLRQEPALLAGLEVAIVRQEPARRASTQAPAEKTPGAEPSAPVVSIGVGVQPNNLPGELTSFVGRETELDEIAVLLSTSRLVTLTGSGGVGKTRLALRMARAEVSRPGEGVWLAELAAASDSKQVLRELANTVGVRDEAGVDLAVAVSNRLGDGEQLLVLDNCEQVSAAVAELAVRLRQARGGLRLLVTSREPLRVAGEAVYRVPSMSVPEPDDKVDPGELMSSEAIRLLVERARAQQPGFKLDASNSPAAASLCRRLDGIPLALELAAARVRSMSLADIERRLDGRFRLLTGGSETVLPRQRTLRALVDWSYDLLSDAERAVLCRLSVFAGGWDLAAAETVAGDENLDRWAVMDLLSSLVDKSLVQGDTTADAARYWLLETVREYAAERGHERGERELATARLAHARLFLDLAETAAPHFSGAGQVVWRSRLELDYGNLRAAFSYWLSDPSGADEALRFGTALGWFWSSRGSYGEGVELIETALGRHDATAPTALRCATLNIGGHLLCRRGDLTRAQIALEEAVGIARSLADPALTADALRNLAWVADRRGEHDKAIELATESVELASRCEESHLLARAYDVRAAARQDQDPAGARSDYAISLRYCEAAEDHHGQASTLNNLAVLELEQGHHDEARHYFARGLEVARETNSVGILPYLEYGVGLAAALEGELAEARPAFATALQIARQTGQRSLVAYAILGLAVTSDRRGQEQQSAMLHGAAMAIFDQLREAPEPLEAGLRQRSLAALRVTIGDGVERYAALGRSLPLSEAIALSLRPDSEGLDSHDSLVDRQGGRDTVPNVGRAR
jgi:predicted ATPase/DNA-binding SARP family transcriptional activator